MVEDLLGVTEADDEAIELGRVEGSPVRTQPGGADEEVQEDRRLAGGLGEEKPAGAGPGQRALGNRRRERRRADRIDGRAAARQGLGARPRALGVAGGDGRPGRRRYATPPGSSAGGRSARG